MNGNEFLKFVRREARRRGLGPVELITARGKGSHITVRLGDRFTVLKDRKKEISKGLLSALLRQLGLD